MPGRHCPLGQRCGNDTLTDPLFGYSTKTLASDGDFSPVLTKEDSITLPFDWRFVMVTVSPLLGTTCRSQSTSISLEKLGTLAKREV
jgi:hypothetical protein